MQAWFTRIADAVANLSATPWASVVAMLLIVVWAVTGPFFDFSDQWEAHINTVTALVTFLMVFLLQHTQNRDTKAMQLKLNELLRASEGAREQSFIALEKKSEQEQAEIEEALEEACEVEPVEAVLDSVESPAGEPART